MMKKPFAILLFFLVSSATCLADDAATVEAQPPDEPPKWPWYPMPNPPPHPFRPPHQGDNHQWFPFPWTQPYQRPPFSWGQYPFNNPKVLKCLKSFQVERTCVHEILVSFRTHNVNLGPECCQSIQQVNEDCVSPVFASFNNPFFGLLLKEYCARKAAPPPTA